MERPRRIIIRTAWCLAKSYWKSAEKRSAWSLLVAVIVLNLGNVYIGVRINEWNRAFYNALQTFNAMAFFRQVGIFGILAAVAVLISVSALYLNQLLQIRWRRWLTKKYLAAWLADRAYYKLQLGSAADNPDQRISGRPPSVYRLYIDSIARADFIGRFPIFISQHPLGTFWCSRHSSWSVRNRAYTRLSGLGGVDLRRAGYLAGGHHRSSIGGAEFGPTAL
jgi:hypothetical protein